MLWVECLRIEQLELKLGLGLEVLLLLACVAWMDT